MEKLGKRDTREMWKGVGRHVGVSNDGRIEIDGASLARLVSRGGEEPQRKRLMLLRHTGFDGVRGSFASQGQLLDAQVQKEMGIA